MKKLEEIASEAKKIINWPGNDGSAWLVDKILEGGAILTPNVIAGYFKIYKNASLAPAIYYILVAKIIPIERLYELFVPLFQLEKDPIDPVFLRYLLGYILGQKLISRSQARQFVTALIESSDIERIYQDNKLVQEAITFPDVFADETPEDSYLLNTDFWDKEIEKWDDFEVIVEPTIEDADQAAVTILYGWADTFFDNINDYLGSRW